MNQRLELSTRHIPDVGIFTEPLPPVAVGMRIAAHPPRMYGRPRCCSARCNDADRRDNLLSKLDSEGSAFDAKQQAGLRLLMLTGCRRNEILTLRWEDVDLKHDEIRLRDARTGARAVPLSPTARQVLASLPRQPDNPWVIFGRGPGARLSNLNATWGLVRKKAGLEDVRIHDLRHSFASRALSLGESLPMIGRLLGHRKVQTTARYAHLARDSVKVAAERVSESLAVDLDNAPDVSAAV